MGAKGGLLVGNDGAKKGSKGKEQANQKDTDGKELEGRPVLKTAMSTRLPLPQIVIGALELCTYFPQHARWPRYLLRLLRNDWRSKDIVKAQLHARGELNKANLKLRDDAIRKQILTNGRVYYNNRDWNARDWFRASHADSAPYPATRPFPNLYTPGLDQAAWGPAAQKSWTLAAGTVSSTPPTFLEMYQGVIHHPTGQDAGVLTQILHWASQQGRSFMLRHDASDIPAIIQANPNTFVLPHEARNTATWDQSALGRLRANVPDPLQ
ncbi:hypothetical protein AC578_2349 [Pseudocercospora eumusae]|uniref:Uncharacterized protein n=1 Tax=Pseudocercospora eumusae TaxID=321146 RepID=A0A139HXS3_9PEZI|nr:hypothetical protein AC578_2349 [Pseudocercospora eumusae]